MNRPPARKHILFIARWYPERRDEMLGLFVQRHAQAVSLLHQVSVLYVAADDTRAPGSWESEATTFEGIREYRYYFGKHSRALYNAIAYMKGYLRLLAEAEKAGGPVDLIHVHVLTRCAIPAFWLKITRGIPYVVTEHWSRYLPRNVEKGAYAGKVRRLATRFLARHADAITTVTDNLARAMQNLGLTNRYFTIPNVADVHAFLPVDAGNLTSGNFLHVSCFDEPAKNVKGIINAFEKLEHTHPGIKIDLVGTGPDFESVRAYADSKGLTGRVVFFKGLMTGEPLQKMMREAFALVMFSRYENLPCTIVESISSGVPVISTDVGGISEHVHPDFGMLIREGDEAALCASVEYMLQHRKTFDTARMRTYAVDRFSYEAVAREFDAVYSHCLDR